MRAIVTVALVLCASSGVAVSGEGDRKQDLSVYGDNVGVRRWTEDPSPEEVRILSEDEVREIRRAASKISSWAERYPHENIEPGQLSPAILDFFWYEWLSDDAPDRPAPEEAVRVLGSAFGHYLAIKLGMEWVEVTDQYGTDVCVRGSPGDVTVCPESVVAKRVESRGEDFFGAVFQATKQQLADSST